MKRIALIIVFISSMILAQGTAGTTAKYEYRKLIDMQTAGVLEKGFVAVSSNLLPYGIGVFGLEVGVFDNVSFGISYGAENIIGIGNVIGYKYPGVNFKFRVVEEDETFPAFTIGFNSQGTGKYYSAQKRYDYKSDGIFLAASKNFAFLGYLSIHGELNYSFDGNGDDDNINLKIGAEKTVGKIVSLLVEYDFAVNDNGTYALGDGKGYLNAGVHISLGKGFTFGIDMRNLLNNKKTDFYTAERGLFFEYIAPVFQ